MYIGLDFFAFYILYKEWWRYHQTTRYCSDSSALNRRHFEKFHFWTSAYNDINEWVTKFHPLPIPNLYFSVRNDASIMHVICIRYTTVNTWYTYSKWVWTDLYHSFMDSTLKLPHLSFTDLSSPYSFIQSQGHLAADNW